jgi:large subunit ribosomal protein L16
LIEADGVPFEMAKEALRLAAQKLPVTTKFVVRRDYVESAIANNETSEIKKLSH